MTDIIAKPQDDLTSLKWHGFTGLVAIFGLFGGLCFWASTVDIAGAVVSSGTVVVESFAKRVQHQEGGIVKAFFVRNEDVVTEGQLLAVLDDTAISADLSVVETQWREAMVREARLVAEIDRKDDFALPEELSALADDAEIAKLTATEKQVLLARRAARDSRTAQLTEQITQLDRQIEGLDLQQTAIDRQLGILTGEMASLNQLYKGQLVEISRITTIDKQQAEAEGERGRLIAAIAEARAAIAEKRLQMTQLDDDFLSSALAELQETRRTIAEASQQKRAALDRLKRTELRAPQAGVIHESIVHTIGGVVAPGETLMLVVPQDDALLVNIRINPMDVDRIHTGQDVTLRLSSLDQRTTPELSASVAAIAPDLSQDPATGVQYYSARIDISDAEMDKLPDHLKLVPGMPVEAFVKTAERSVLSYLLNPIIEEFNLAMRED